MIMDDKLAHASWRVSSYSGGGGNTCVEVGPAPEVVGVRDSTRPAAGAFAASPQAWRSFVTGVKRDRLA